MNTFARHKPSPKENGLIIIPLATKCQATPTPFPLLLQPQISGTPAQNDRSHTIRCGCAAGLPVALVSPFVIQLPIPEQKVDKLSRFFIRFERINSGRSVKPLVVEEPVPPPPDSKLRRLHRQPDRVRVPEEMFGDLFGSL